MDWASIGGGFASALTGGLFNRSSAKSQAKLQRNNWEYMQNNAHQFEVADLRNAGLNPILSATNSQLASAPSVSGSTIDTSGIHSGFKASQDKAVSLAIADMENKVKLGELDIKQKDLDLKRIYQNQQIKESDFRIDNIIANTEKVFADIKNNSIITSSTAALNETRMRNDTLRTAQEIATLRSNEVASYSQAQQGVALARLYDKKGLLTDVETKQAISDLESKQRRNELTGEYYSSWYGRLLYKAGLVGADTDSASRPLTRFFGG